METLCVNFVLSFTEGRLNSKSVMVVGFYVKITMHHRDYVFCNKMFSHLYCANFLTVSTQFAFIPEWAFRMLFSNI